MLRIQGGVPGNRTGNRFRAKHQPSKGPRLMNQETQRIPVMQRILENPFLLLFIGVAFPTVFYIIWGIMEIVTIPIAK
jgi:hypothetical protein